jgi:transcriptional regulator with XRE-family HTH domain
MVPKRLKEAREEACLTQEQLAELVGIDGVNLRSRLSNYEVGRFTPSFEFIVRVSKALNYPENFFYTVDDDFAHTVLQIHRNRTDASINPYYNTLLEARKLAKALNECLKKAVD